jgi:hypothetical protein
MTLKRCLSKKIGSFFIWLLAVIFLFGCNSGSGGDTGKGGNYVTGQAVLGPLAGASVTVYEYPHLEIALYSTTTSESEILSVAGLFFIPEDLFKDDPLYVIEVSGGNDIDADDDGIVNNIPTVNSGTLHLTATGSQLKTGDFYVNILSDISYYKLRYLFLARYPQESIQDKMTAFAKILLKEDVNGDGDRDWNDILKWNPVTNKDSVQDHFPTESYMEAVRSNATYESRSSLLQERIVGTFRDEALSESDNPYYRNVAISEGYAFVTGPGGMRILDVADPTRPVLMGNFYEFGNEFYHDVLVSGDYAYIYSFSYVDTGTSTISNSSIQIVDIGNPADPARVGSIRNSVLRNISGNYLYTHDIPSRSLQIIDIGDPAAPILISTLDTPGVDYDVFVSGDYAYVADFDGGLQIVDITRPSQPEIVGAVKTTGKAMKIGVSDENAYIVELEGDGFADLFDRVLRIVDVHDPENPVLSGVIDDKDYIFDVKVSDDYIYFRETDKLGIADISEPSNQRIVEYIPLPNDAKDLAISGKHAYVAGDAGFYIVDVSDPGDAAAFCTVGTPNRVMDVAASGDYVYVADDSGLRVVDIRDPVVPTISDVVDASGDAVALSSASDAVFSFPPRPDVRDVIVSGNHLYFVNSSGALEIFDIRMPSDPIKIATMATESCGTGVAMTNNYAYITASELGLRVVDVSKPEAPFLVGSIDTDGTAYGVSVSGDFAYVADGDAGLQIVDISDPAYPEIVGTVDIPGIAEGVTLSGRYAYVFDYGSGFYCVDIADPLSPALVASFEMPANAAAVSGDYAYVADTDAIVHVIDIENPEAPVDVAAIRAVGDVVLVAISGGYVFAASTRALTIFRAIPAS